MGGVLLGAATSFSGTIVSLPAALDGRAVDLLINNAGVGDRAGLGQLDFDQFAHVMNVNTLGPLRVIQALQGNVAVGAGKKIANISSQLGSIENTTGDMGLTYRTSKAGLNMALKAAAAKLAEQGISMLTLHPGWVATDMGGAQAPVRPANPGHRLLQARLHQDQHRPPGTRRWGCGTGEGDRGEWTARRVAVSRLARRAVALVGYGARYVPWDFRLCAYSFSS